MAIRLKCKCGQAMQVDESMAGRTGKCPKCGTAMKIPTADEIQQFKKTAMLRKTGGTGIEPAVESGSAPAAEETKTPPKVKGRVPTKRSTKKLARTKDDDPDKEKTRLRKLKPGAEPKKGRKTAVLGKAGRKGKTGKFGKEPGSTKMGPRSSRKGSQATSGKMSAKYMQPKKKYWIHVLIVIGIAALGGIGYWIYYSSINSYVKKLNRFNKYVESTQFLRDDLKELANQFKVEPPLIAAFDNENGGPRQRIENAWGNIEKYYEREGYSEFEDFYNSYGELDDLKEKFIGEDMRGMIKQYTSRVSRSTPDQRLVDESKNNIGNVMLEILSKLEEIKKELRKQFYFYAG